MAAHFVHRSAARREMNREDLLQWDDTELITEYRLPEAVVMELCELLRDQCYLRHHVFRKTTVDQ